MLKICLSVPSWLLRFVQNIVFIGKINTKSLPFNSYNVLQAVWHIYNSEIKATVKVEGILTIYRLIWPKKGSLELMVWRVSTVQNDFPVVQDWTDSLTFLCLSFIVDTVLSYHPRSNVTRPRFISAVVTTYRGRT